jgi:hypothetical protein
MRPGPQCYPGVDTVTGTRWAEQEYLGLYDRIVWGDLLGHEKKIWVVLNQNANTTTELSEWLRE